MGLVYVINFSVVVIVQFLYVLMLVMVKGIVLMENVNVRLLILVKHAQRSIAL
jgi:hypothetical protein